MARGERPTKIGYSWFSAKSISVERMMSMARGRALNGLGHFALPTPGKLRIQAVILSTDRLIGCEEPKSRGKQPRSYAKVPKQSLSGKGSDRAMTTRRWAWKQPSFEESVIAHWSSSMAPKMSQSSSDSPKRRDLESSFFKCQ